MPARGDSASPWRRISPSVFAGEKTAREREIRKKRDTGCGAFLKDTVLGIAAEQTVLVLHRNKTGASWSDRMFGLTKLIDGEVRTADLPNLSGFYKRIECAECVGNRDRRIGCVELVEVDVICLEALEAVLGGAEHIFGASAFPVVVDPHAEFGGDDHILAALAKSAPEELLALRAAVAVGGVEEIDSRMESGIHYFCCGCGVQAPAKIIAADSDPGYVESADSSFVHGGRSRYYRAACRGHPEIPRMLQPARLTLFLINFCLAVCAGGLMAACAGGMRAAGNAGNASLPAGVGLATFDSIWSTVTRTYVDTAFVSGTWMHVRDSLRPRASAITTRGELDALMGETLATIPDSHFYIIPASVAGDEPQTSSSDGRGTTGVSLRMAGEKIVVWRVEPGSPAAAAGIVPGEVVTRVGVKNADSLVSHIRALPEKARQRAIANMLHGINGPLSPAVGDTVAIQLANPSVTRRLVAVPAPGRVSQFGNLPPLAGVVRVARIPASGTGCVGVIAFNIWLPALGGDLERAVDSVRTCSGVVVDLRGNPGGAGAMVMGFGGYFVDSALRSEERRVGKECRSRWRAY